MRNLFIFLTLLSFGSLLLAEELTEKDISVTTEQEQAPLARKELQDQAVSKVTEEMARELMGAAKYEKNHAVIQNKISKMSGRYISYIKPGDLKSLAPSPGYSMKFLMKVSPLSLKAILQSAGLLSDNDTVPVVLPLISFYDRVGVSTYKWWQPGDYASKRFMINTARTFETSLSQAFRKQQFFVIRTMEINAAALLPVAFQNDHMAPADLEFLGKMFQAPLVLEGQVEVSRSQLGSNLYRIDIKMSALQLSNNRPIADVSRKYDTESGPLEIVTDKKLHQVLDTVTQDLASQVFEAWQKGTVGTNIIQLTVRGKLPLDEREILKDKIRAQVPQIKNIRERLIASNLITFEVDSSSSPLEIGQKLTSLDFNGQKFVVSSSSEKEIVMDIKR